MANESKPAAATVIHEEHPLKFERAIAEVNSLWLDTGELKRLANGFEDVDELRRPCVQTRNTA